LVGIRGKTCSVAIDQVLPRMPANQMRVLQVLPRMSANQMGALQVFTANASQTNESVTSARVAGAEVCGCHGDEN